MFVTWGSVRLTYSIDAFVIRIYPRTVFRQPPSHRYMFFPKPLWWNCH